MTIVQINTCPNGSTGRIMFSIHYKNLELGHKSYVVWGRGRASNNNNEICIYNRIGVLFHKIYSFLFGKQGFASKRATRDLIKKLDIIKPDIVHLHNLHGNYLNIEELFNYLIIKGIRILWTFHDCWPITGRCAHFDSIKCYNWENGCGKCPNRFLYPVSLLDCSKNNYKRKKELFLNANMEIVVPSAWLYDIIKKSYLNIYPVTIINNGINIEMFKNTTGSFRNVHNILNKKMILGVSSPWSQKKGFNDFIELSKIINEDYVIVMVGLTEKEIKRLPKNVIGIKRTESQKELAELYSTADLFLNPTYEDNYPTVNLEAISCGTPVLTYKTGGSAEFIKFLEPSLLNYSMEKGMIIKNPQSALTIINEIINSKGVFKLKNKEDISEEHMAIQYINIYESMKVNK